MPHDQTDDEHGGPDAPAYGDQCEECGTRTEPLRRIMMKEGKRELLCRGCFETAFEEQRVHPADPRVPHDIYRSVR
jgi:hypothetical protein